MSKKVMIVDDSGSFRTVVKLALQKAGYETIEAVDGKDACSKLNRDNMNLACREWRRDSYSGHVCG